MITVIGISGPTGSGKSTFAGHLVGALASLDPVLLRQDLFFRDWRELSERERERKRTTNHPRGVLWEALEACVRELRAGGAATVPVPGTRADERGEPIRSLGPSSVVLVEGHLLYNRGALRDLLDLRLFVDVGVHERVIRRLSRDVENGTQWGRVAAWYRRDVVPNVGAYSEAGRRHADLVIPYEDVNQVAVDTIAAWVRRR